MTNRCCVKEHDYSTGKDKRCKRPIGTLERDKGFKTCATHGQNIERKNMTREYVQNHQYGLPHAVNTIKEVYGENEYGEKIFFDGEWFHHDDCGKVKILRYGGGVAMLDENGEGMMCSIGEIRRMLNMLYEAGAIWELGMEHPRPTDEILIQMGLAQWNKANNKE